MTRGTDKGSLSRYLPYWGFSESEKFAQQSVGRRPNVSRDNVLTVFAQLASLRLEAKRALISLFDRTSQHVVAESTPYLQLRSPESGEGPDALWRGVHQLPRRTIPMCDLAMKSFTGEGKKSFMIPDLTKDSRFNTASFVTGAPHHRFYISVPIITPESYIIGSIAVLDDKPRDALTKEQTQLLEDLSLTLMDYLISQRAMREEHREEKMVRALGLFFRGKSDLSEGMDVESKVIQGEDEMEHVNKKLEKVQISSSQESSEERSRNTGRGRDAKSASEAPKKTEQEPNRKPSRSLSPVRQFKSKDSQTDDSDTEKEENDLRPTLSPTTERLQKSFAPTTVQSVLNRACNLMNQALEIEGAMFVDASVYTRRQMIGSDNQPSGSDKGEKLEDSDPVTGPKAERRQSLKDDINGPKSLVLGHSTSSKSGKAQQGSHYVPLPGSFINHLIDRYPRGKIFHIEKDGSVAVSYEGLADDVSQQFMAKEYPVLIKLDVNNGHDISFITTLLQKLGSMLALLSLRY